MEHWVTQFMEQYGYLGIFIVMVVENLFPPIPSEVVLPFGGYMATRSELETPYVILVSTLGSIVGAVILYAVGTILSMERVLFITDRYGRFLRIKREDIHKSFDWFERYGKWTVFFGRMVPLIRSLISIPAGMSRMNFPLFLVYTAIGSAIWNTLLVVIGAYLGSSWDTITKLVGTYSNIIYVLIAVTVVGTVIWLYSRKAK